MDTETTSRWLKIALSGAAVALILARVVRPEMSIDAATVGLVLVAIFPWLPSLVPMKDFADLLRGMASILWPVIGVAALLLFKQPIGDLIESGKSRKVTMKVGGQELTMEEASSQQQTFISDLQAQVVDLRKKFEGISGGTMSPNPSNTPPATLAQGRSVLWVDDQPKNNSYFVQQLLDQGFTVDLAVSTADGLDRFNRKHYGVVISDMGREDGGSYNSAAGIDLLRSVQAKDPTIPFIIFCSSSAARQRGPEALKLGATAVTSSPTELFGLLGLGERES